MHANSSGIYCQGDRRIFLAGENRGQENFVRSEYESVEEYLAELSEERRNAIQTVRETILENLPDGFEETMNWGMISYQVPLEIYPDTYNGQPLLYAALASRKNHMAVYLTGIYMDQEALKEFEEAYRATGKRCDVGKSCVRFRKLDDLPLSLIGKAVSRMTMEKFIRRMEEIRPPKKGKTRDYRG